jgi:hypothetical protein
LSAEATLSIQSQAKTKLNFANYCPRLSSQTVYWELIENAETGTSLYDIYVLLTMKKPDHADGIETVAAHFKNGTSEAEKKVYKKIEEYFSEK